MTLNEFQTLALRTYNDLGDKLKNSLHMTTGMASEFNKEARIAQINNDKVNLMEEFGDILWFAVVYAHIYNIKIPVTREPIDVPHSVFSEFNVAICIGGLLDLDKAELAYGRKADEDERTRTLQNLFNHMYLWAGIIEINPEMAMERVIAKLKKRFPEKFSTEQAITRNLEVERAALEGNQEAA